MVLLREPAAATCGYGPDGQAEIWRGMAEEARKVASRLHDAGLRHELLIIAAKYETLARKTETLARIAAAANSNEPPQDASD